MSIIYQNQSRTPIYPNTSLTKVYYQSTVVWESSHYQPDEILFESSTAGTYSLDILDTANYEVYCIGGGSGCAGYAKMSKPTYSMAASGGSGSGFIGIITIPNNTYNIVVGGGGNRAMVYNGGSRAISGAGGNSLIENVITSYGGSEAIAYTSGSHGGYGGSTPTINVTIISYTLNTTGNNGYTSKSSVSQTASVYNNYGYGGGNNANGGSGYIKIIYKSS